MSDITIKRWRKRLLRNLLHLDKKCLIFCLESMPIGMNFIDYNENSYVAPEVLYSSHAFIKTKVDHSAFGYAGYFEFESGIRWAIVQINIGNKKPQIKIYLFNNTSIDEVIEDVGQLDII